MSSSVRTFLPVPGDPADLAIAFAGDPLRWLPQVRREGPGRYVMALHAAAFTRAVRARVGRPWRAGSTHWRSITWDPLGEDGGTTGTDRFLPSFDGEIGLHLRRTGQVTLILDGRYRPPGGPLGAAADAALLHRVARGTTERFLEDVAARLSAEAVLVADATAHERHVSARRHPPHEERAPAVMA